MKAFCVQNRLIWDSGLSELCRSKSNKYAYPYIHLQHSISRYSWVGPAWNPPPRLVLEVGGTSTFQAVMPGKLKSPPLRTLKWGDFSFPGMAACKVVVPLQAQVWGLHAGPTQLCGPKGWNKQVEAVDVDIYWWYVATLLQPVWFHLQISLCQSAVKSYKWSLHSRLLGRGHWTGHSVLLCSLRQL